MEYDIESQDKKDMFERRLTDCSIEKTISEVLVEIAGNTRVKIKSVKSQDMEGEYGTNVLAAYKDGMAFMRLSSFSNGTGTRFHYALHRNGEDNVYILDDQNVLMKNHFSLKKKA